MESCNIVEHEIEKVVAKFQQFGDNFDSKVDDLIELINGLKEHLDNLPIDYELTELDTIRVKFAVKQTPISIDRMSIEHRNLHSVVSKVGKAIDRNFDLPSEIVEINKSNEGEGIFKKPNAHKLLNHAVCLHLYHEGLLNIGDTLAAEGGIELAPREKFPHIVLNQILDSLKQGNLDLALNWAIECRKVAVSVSTVKQEPTELEFKLHRLAFLKIVKGGRKNQIEALTYAREQLAPFMNRHEKEIQVLMGTLSFMGGNLEESPYAHLFGQLFWDDAIDSFKRELFSRHRISYESVLSTCFAAGCKSLPPAIDLTKMTSSIRPRIVIANLPLHIDLGKEFRFHSVFACPILRQQCSHINPPMRLTCGHVFSKDALQRLSTTTRSRTGRILKCPYCPWEQNPNEARQITF